MAASVSRIRERTVQRGVMPDQPALFTIMPSDTIADGAAPREGASPYPNDFTLTPRVCGRRRRRQQTPVHRAQGRTLTDALTDVAAQVHVIGKLDERLQRAVREALKRIARSLPQQAAVAWADAESLIHRLRAILASNTEEGAGAPDATTTMTPHHALWEAHAESVVVPSARSSPKRQRAPTIYTLGEIPAAETTEGHTGVQRIDRRVARAQAMALQNAEYLEEHNAALQLILAMQRHGNLRAAMDELQIPIRRLRWAQRKIAQYARGVPLYDRRHLRQNPPTVLTAAVERDILAVWNTHPAATITAVVRLVQQRIHQRNHERTGQHGSGETPPSESTIRRYLRALPRPLQEARGGHLQHFHAQSRLVGIADAGLYPNDTWELDSSEVPVYVKLRVLTCDGTWTLKGHKLWVSTATDVFSRAIVGYALQTGSPDAELGIAALASGMLHTPTPARPFTGIPREIRVDRGAEFQERLRELLGCLDVVLTVSPPRSPNTRPFIERTFQSLWVRFSASVGYAPAERGIVQRDEKRATLYPTFEEFTKAFHHAVADYNHSVHSGTGEAPVERWRAIEGIRAVPSAAAHLLLTRDPTRRTVRAGGIEFENAEYTHPLLQDYGERSVIVHYSAQHREHVHVLDAETHEHLCLASLRAMMSRVIRRSTVAYKTALRARTKGYVETPPLLGEAPGDVPERPSAEGEEARAVDGPTDRGPQRGARTESRRQEIQRNLRATWRAKDLARRTGHTQEAEHDPAS